MKARRQIIGMGIGLAALAAGAFPATAAAEERVCRGAIGAQTVDNLRVPQNASCQLDGTYVKGTVKVQRGARLTAERVRVIGNVQGEGARNVVVRAASRIGGSFQVVQGGAATLRSTAVKGAVLLDDQGGALRVLDNRVEADVQAFQNTGGVAISRNVIDGNLQCKENRPAPTGGGNRVGGNKEDQCARL